MEIGILQPAYLALYKSGELERRVDALEARLASCDICPRMCGVNRLENKLGVCHSGRLPIVSTVCAHHGEEPAISGGGGSGTIFFGNCNMRCVYCQNYQISQDHRAQKSKEIEHRVLAEHMLRLQEKGCHNVNLVSPSHFAPQIARALLEAVPMGFRLPLVYNTSSYDCIDTLMALDGIIDIYLADLRYASDKWGRKLSGVPDYVERARGAIREMCRQVGNLVEGDVGVARRGLIVRLLILPNRLAGVAESLRWLASEISTEVTLSVMSQYYPAHKAPGIPMLARKISAEEYTEVTELMERLDMENGWIQEMDSSESYLPDFSRDDSPFSQKAG